MVGSTAHRQRQYRQRLKRQSPELLRKREREKSRRHRLKLKFQATPFCSKYPLNEGINHHSNSKESDANGKNPANEGAYNNVYRRNRDCKLSTSCSIYDILELLEHIDIDDSVKYQFLKHASGAKPIDIEPPRSDTNHFGARSNFSTEPHERAHMLEHIVIDDKFNFRKHLSGAKHRGIELSSVSSASGISMPGHKCDGFTRTVQCPGGKKTEKKTKRKKKKAEKNVTKRKTRSIIWEALYADDDSNIA